MKSILVAVVITFTIFPAAAVVAEWSGEEVTRDGVIHVVNPEEPMAVIRVELEELWERGGEDDDILFGRLSQIVHGADGNVYVLDSQLTEVKVFSPTGEYLRTVGRQGEGPGEFMNVTDLYVSPNGLLGLVRIFPGRVYQIGADGTPADFFALPETEGFQLVYVGRANADRIVIAGGVQTRGDGTQLQTSYLKAFDADGNELAQFCERTTETRFGGMKFDEKTFSDFSRRWALADDGRVAVAMEFDDYAIDLYNADGSLNRVVDRPGYKLVKRTDEELKRFQLLYDGITQWSPGRTFQVSKTHAAVARVWFRPDGRLWVMSSHGIYGRSQGVFASIDEYDRDGRYARRIDLVVDGDPTEDGIFFLGDRMYRVTDLFSSFIAALGGADEYDVGEADPLRLVAYQLDMGEIGMK